MYLFSVDGWMDRYHVAYHKRNKCSLQYAGTVFTEFCKQSEFLSDSLSKSGPLDFGTKK